MSLTLGDFDIFYTVQFYFIFTERIDSTSFLVLQRINGHDVQRSTELEADVRKHYLLCPRYV